MLVSSTEMGQTQKKVQIQKACCYKGGEKGYVKQINSY